MKIIKVVLFFLFSTIASAQHLTISNSGETGTSGINWSITGNELSIGSSGSASINTSVITNHLATTGNLTINLPGQLNVARNIYINNTIAYSGSSARTLTFQSGNDIVFANTVGITSATASLNIVLRSATTTGTPDNGSVKMDGINIVTKGGHLWVGGGASTTTWNGLNVGNSSARTYLDDVAGISVVGSTIASGGGNIYMYGLSWNSGDADGINYGTNFENSVMSSGTGTIYFAGGVYGQYTNGTGMRIYGTTTTSITSTTGAIYIYGYGTDSATNGNAGRTAATIQGTASIKSESGDISVIGDAAFAATVNDKEGLMIASGAAICSKTGNITLRGTNTLESSGQFSNSIRFAAADVANSIRIGYDGTNAYSGNILIEGNSIYQRYTYLGSGSIAVQTTGTLTIQPTGTAFTFMRAANSDPLTYDEDWNFGTNLGGFVYGKSTNTTALTYSNSLTTNGPITMYAGTLTQNGAVSSGGAITFNCTDFTLGANLTVSTNNPLSILSKTFIKNTTATTITTAGGNVVMASNTDDATDNDTTTNGYIQFLSGLTMTTNGGNITLGGGDATASGYALGTSAYPYEGIRIDGTLNINSGGGNIIMRGKSYAISTTAGSWGTGFWNLSTGSITSGTGTITLDGFSQSYNGTHNAGIYTYGALTVTSANTTADAIKLIGKGTGNGNEAWAIEAESALSLIATGEGGGITMSSSQQNTASNLDIVLRGETNILAKSGPINLLGGQSSGIADGYVWIGGAMFIGSKASGAVPISSSNIVMQYDKYYSAANPNVATSGTVLWKPLSASFGQTVETSTFNWNQNGQTMSGLTIGKPGNTSTITHQTNAITAAGPVSVYGGALAFNSALTATNSNINLFASGAVTQTAALSANGLDLNGTGTYTLTNTSNAITTLSGGSSTSKLGSLSFVDASGGLTLGALNNTGITASGAISVATFNGDITLSNNIQTDNTTSSAVIINAGQSRSLGDAQGGNIIISGSPVITTGANGITKLFSGREAESTGLTSYVGGSANVRNSVDESTVTFSPVLSAGNKHALYRYDANLFGNITIVTSGGASINNGWEFVNNTIQPTSATAVSVNASVVNAYLIANPLTIRAGSITFNANVTGTNANNLSILSNTYIDNSSATTITTQGGNVLFASNVDNDTDGETTTNGYIQLRQGITINSNGGNITFGGGNMSGTDYSLGSSDMSYTEGIRFDTTIALNSGGGNITLRGKSYAMGVNTFYGASGVGFYYLSTTGSINSGTGTITIDGFSQTNTSTYASGIYSMSNITITSANTTADAIRLLGKASGTSGEAWGIETESIFSVLATGTGGGITVSSSQQNSGNNYDVVFRGETNLLAKSGPINLLGGQSGGLSTGTLLLGNNLFLGSKASSAVPTSSSNITIQYHLHNFSGYTPKLATSGTLNWTPVLASFGQNVATDFFSWSQNGQTLSGLTIGKSGNIYNVSINSVITTTGPVNVYGATIGITGALTASGSDVSFYATTAVTQSQPIISSGLSLNGTGTFTLTNTSNNFTTLAGGAVGSLLGATQVTDVSGGLTIGTIGSNSGLKGSSTILVETLAGNLTLTGSISTNSTSTDAVILTAAKSTAIGIGTGGDIIVSGTPTITMGSGGIAKLFSGLESTSTGLTTLAGGSSNVRNNYDETTSTFSPVLSANNKHAIYRTSAGVGDLTIVSTGGDAINSTWTYENGIINTITSSVNILSSVIENYLSSGPLTINAGNTTINAAITNTSSNALVLNGNSTLTNTTPTTTVSAAITNAGPININTGAFNIAHNISTTSTAAITISAANGFSTSTSTGTRRTISTQGGNITINADNDANGSGWLDIDDLTLNPGAANSIVRGETFNFNTDQSRKLYINGTGSFTFESNDVTFGAAIESNWFVLDQDANGISGLTLGKSGNAANVSLNSTFTVAGPINVNGGYVSVTGNITSSGTNDIFLKGIENTGSSVNISGVITKASGTGTLTMQANGRAINSGTISATGTGVLNLVMWSDYDGDNVGGGSTLNGGSVSTNGGHVWMGGSNSNGGSYNWNGLAVGDGPSIGTGISNCHAIDLFAPITTAGGDVLLWAGNGGCGTSGIVTNVNQHLNAGSGDITLIAYQTSGAIELTSTGVISLLPHAGSYASALTLGGTLTSGSFTFNTSYYNGLKINSIANSGLVIGNYSGHLSGATAVAQGNTSNVTVSSALSTKSLEIHGAAIALNENITTTGTGADVLIKGTSNINLAASKTITTAAGDVNLWADSDDNATGYVQLLAGAAINSTGGDINLGGGSSLATDYAFGSTAETCPEVVGTQYISGVHLRQSSSLNSNGGNISVRGQNANTANAAMSFGISLRGITMNSGIGKIALNGIATGSGSVNAQGVASWGTLILRSANTSSDAISITGNALSSTGGSSLGINVVALFEATGVGGGITITGKSGVASTNASVNLGGDILAASGPIIISGENISGVVDNIMIGSTTTIGKKSGTNVTASSSNVILEGNRINTAGAVFVDCTGTLTVQPFGNSFASALSWPMANVTHVSSLTGLTIGKSTNTANITFANATTINGPITAYGGSITVSAAVSAAGAILLDGDTGSFLTQNTKGVEINAAVTTTNNGNITIFGRGGSGNAQFGNFGVQIAQKVEAGGSGTITVTGIGGLSSDGPSGSSHGVNLDGSSAWIKSNGGNVTVTGNGGGANSGTYSQGVVMLNSSRISAGGSGILTITGTGGVNTIMGLRGVVINSGSSVFTAGGAININGYHGTNGSDYSDGVSLDGAIIGSDASGAITIVGTAGGGTGSDAISMSTTSTIGGATHANNVVLRGNNMALAGTNSVTTSGQVTIEPYSNSFTSALVFPIPNLTLANTITGLTLGKLTNSANITFNSNTNIAGPIIAYGGTITLDANLTTTNNGAISLFSDNALGGLSSARTITAAGAFKFIPRGTAFAADVTYPITNLTATSTGLTIGKSTNTKNITINQDVTGGAGIELYGANVNINSNLKTTNSGLMYLKGNTTIAAGKYIESSGNFTHDGNLIFKSNALGTAAFGTLGGTFTTTSGTSTVERYIPARRAFRFLSPSVTTTTSIRDNWQENGGTDGGLGTHITGLNGSANGFDATTTNNPSLFTINHSTGAWEAITNTSSNTLSAGTAYRLMVRGDRLTDLTTNAPTATVTTLRATGILKTGDYNPILNQASEGYSFVGNPYQAPVDIKAVLTASTNMNSGLVYYWDPTLNARGTYVTRDLTSNNNSVTSSFNQYLQPGQAVFVKKAATSNAASILFSENNKSVANSAAGVFRTTTSEFGTIRTNLRASIDNQWTTIEGALAIFNPMYSWDASQEDANKLSNLDEEVSFMQNNISLAIACQPNPSATNELPIRLNNTRHANYQWRFELADYSGPTPYLFDTQNNTYTQIDNATIVPFTVNGQELTRFKIVFQNGMLSTPDFSNQIVLYPNPGASGASSFYIQGISDAQVTMFTLLGQNIPVKTATNGKGMEVISKTSLSKGVYLVRITKDSKTSNVKWIVE